MMKTLLAAALVALSSSIAAADVTIYGTLEQTVEITNADTGAEGYDVVSGDSAIGFEVTEDLGNGASAFAVIEFDVAAEGGSTVGTDGQAYVGVQGGFGTLKIGQYDNLTASLADSTIDMFEGRGVSSAYDMTVDNAVTYVTPDFGGIQAGIATVADAGDADGRKNADAYEYAVTYNANGLTAGVAYAQDKLNDLDNLFVAGAYNFDNFTVNGAYEDQETSATTNVVTWTVGGAMDIGNNTIRAAYQDIDDDNKVTGTSGNTYTFEGVHNLSVRTAMYVNYQIVDNDVANTDSDVFGLGLRHNF